MNNTPKSQLSFSTIKKNLFTQISKQDFDQIYRNPSYIASGMQGQVWKATFTDEYVAIKYFRKQFIKPSLINYIKSEIQMLDQLRHENIVSLLASYQVQLGDYNIRFCIVTEYCQETFRSYHIISKLKNIEKLRLCEQLLAGIKAAHDKDIMHRDIKPQNILIKDLTTMTVKLADFGCARINDESLLMTPSIGTPLYADPNIPLGKYTKKCDVYSAGLVIIYIFCGKHFFSHCENRENLSKCKQTFCKDIQGQTKKFLEYKDLTPKIKQFLMQIAWFTLSDNEEQRLDSSALLEYIQGEINIIEKQEYCETEINESKQNVPQYEGHNPMKKKPKFLVKNQVQRQKKQDFQPENEEFFEPLNNQQSFHEPSHFKQLEQDHDSSKSQKNTDQTGDIQKFNALSYKNQGIFENDHQNSDKSGSIGSFEKKDKASCDWYGTAQKVQNVKESQLSKKSLASNDSNKKLSSNKKLGRIFTNSRTSSLILSNRGSNFKSKIEIEQEMRESRLQEHSKKFTDSEKLCIQVIKSGVGCAAIIDQCQTMEKLLRRFLIMKENFKNIKEIQKVSSASMSMELKECLSFLYHYHYACKLKKLTSYLQGQFGKLSSKNKEQIQKIVIQQVEKILPNLKKYASDLHRKYHLIKPKLSQFLIEQIKKVMLCGTANDLLSIDFEESLIKSEAQSLMRQKLKEIKNQNDSNTILRLYQVIG